MRAIVSLLKFFVGAAFLLSTIGLTFILGAALVGFLFGSTGSTFGVLTIVYSLAAFIFLVLYSGMIALLISVHDRLSEMSILMSERNELVAHRGHHDSAA